MIRKSECKGEPARRAGPNGKKRNGNSSQKRNKGIPAAASICSSPCSPKLSRKGCSAKEPGRGPLGAAYQMKPRKACPLQFHRTTPYVSKDRVVGHMVMVKCKCKAGVMPDTTRSPPGPDTSRGGRPEGQAQGAIRLVRVTTTWRPREAYSRSLCPRLQVGTTSASKPTRSSS